MRTLCCFGDNLAVEEDEMVEVVCLLAKVNMDDVMGAFPLWERGKFRVPRG